MTNKALRIAHIGCGRISTKHFSALNEIRDKFELVAVCDFSLDKAIATGTGAPAFNDFVAMIKEIKPDVVSLATPNGMHPKMIKEVADLGVKNIVCEKPLSIDYASGKEAYDYCKAKGVRLFLIYQNRFNASIIELKKAIDAGKFGRIYLINSNVFWHRPESYYKNSTWHGRPDMDGGAYLTQASHFIDLVLWIMRDSPKLVYAKLARLARDIETEDTGSVIIEFKGGTIASINMTVLTYPKNLEGSITILGEKGTVKVGGIALNEILHWEFSDKTLLTPTYKEHNAEGDSVYGVGHVRNYLDIYESIVSRNLASIEGETILETQKILSAIYESSNKGLPVSLYE
jgi:UDP-N-acetyl-2-amino-2-deoxyglucuronate dehydrogenase